VFGDGQVHDATSNCGKHICGSILLSYLILGQLVMSTF
jgi:hypothetical protein